MGHSRDGRVCFGSPRESGIWGNMEKSCWGGGGDWGVILPVGKRTSNLYCKDNKQNPRTCQRKGSKDEKWVIVERCEQHLNRLNGGETLLSSAGNS